MLLETELLSTLELDVDNDDSLSSWALILCTLLTLNKKDGVITFDDLYTFPAIVNISTPKL